MSAFNKLCSSKSMKTNSLRALVKATYFKLSSCFNCQSSWFCHVNGSLFGSNISTLLASSPLLLWAVESMTAFSTFSSVNNLFIYMPQQAVTLGWNNEMILTYVPQPWLLDLFNDEPELFN